MKILVPIDYSSTSINALRYAQQLLNSTDGGSIELLHVYPLHISGVDTQSYETSKEIIIKEEKAQSERLEDFIEKLDKVEITYKSTVLPGIKAGEVIEEYTELNDFDYVVIGTRGEHNVLDKLFGSVTTYVIHHANCPVLVIPDEVKWKVPKRIGYGSTIHSEEKDAVSGLINFGQRFNSELNYVHVLVEGESEGEKNFPLEFIDKYPIQFSMFYAMSTDSLMEGFDEFVRMYRLDMIALYTPQRKLWNRLFHQSFSSKMVYHTHLPLIVFNGTKKPVYH